MTACLVVVTTAVVPVMAFVQALVVPVMASVAVLLKVSGVVGAAAVVVIRLLALVVVRVQLLLQSVDLPLQKLPQGARVGQGRVPLLLGNCKTRWGGGVRRTVCHVGKVVSGLNGCSGKAILGGVCMVCLSPPKFYMYHLL